MSSALCVRLSRELVKYRVLKYMTDFLELSKCCVLFKENLNDCGSLFKSNEESLTHLRVEVLASSHNVYIQQEVSESFRMLVVFIVNSCSV